MDVRKESLQNPAVVKLLESHLLDMAQHSPPESVHALDIAALQASDVTFWAAWQNEELLGCGALQELSATQGEVKSMRTNPEHLRKGVAVEILKCLIKEAQQRGYTQICLETGSAEAFRAARLLYERHGFNYCPPFGLYTEDPHSLFMQLKL
jgi:putative acetyltransferase